MKRILIVITLIICVLNIRFYPCFSLHINQANDVVYTEKLVDHPAKSGTLYDLPKTLTVGAVGVGETIAGFTLAEVLITLLIIGIVSSIVIPALINDNRDAELKTAWKKAYSDFEQATRKSLIDYAGSFQGVCKSGDAACLRDIYIKHLSYMKKCDVYNSYGKCWDNVGNMKWLNGHTLTSDEMHAQFNDNPAAVLNNGSYVMIATYTDSCNTGGACGWISVDVNGKKPPNTAGKDIFLMYVYNNRIRPDGSNNCNSSGYGWGCSALYLSQ